MCFSASMAQDIEVTGTDPANLGKIKAGAEFNLQINTSFKEGVLNPTVSLFYALGDDAMTAGFNGQLSGNVPDDLQLNLWQPVTATGKAGDTVDFTVVVTILGDKDVNNDTLRTQYILADAAGRDLEIKVTEPEDGTKVKTWTNLPITVQLKNTGSETMPTNTPILYSLTLNGQAQGNASAFTYTGDALEPGDSASLPLGLSIARNAQTGSSDFCFNAAWGVQNGQQITDNEHVRDNNQGCFNVEIEPNSVNENVLKLNSFFYSNNALNLSFQNIDVKERLRCEVIDLAGKTLVSETLPEVNRGIVTNHSILLQNIDQGAYILNIYDGDLPVASRKFVAY